MAGPDTQSWFKRFQAWAGNATTYLKRTDVEKEALQAVFDRQRKEGTAAVDRLLGGYTKLGIDPTKATQAELKAAVLAARASDDPAVRELATQLKQDGGRAMSTGLKLSAPGRGVQGAYHWMKGGGDWKRGVARTGTVAAGAGIIGGTGYAVFAEDE